MSTELGKSTSEAPEKPAAMGWKEMYLKEDWWAIYLGLGIVVAAIAFFIGGGTFMKSLAVLPPAWSSLSQLGGHFAANISWYVLQFIVWLVIFGFSTRIMGFKQSEKKKKKKKKKRIHSVIHIPVCAVYHNFHYRPVQTY